MIHYDELDDADLRVSEFKRAFEDRCRRKGLRPEQVWATFYRKLAGTEKYQGKDQKSIASALIDIYLS